MSVDYERQVVDIAGMVRPEARLAPETVSLATEALYAVHADFGPDSDHPMSFHNGPHSVAVMRRGVRIGNILFPYLSPVHQRRFFDGMILGGATHDRFQLLGPGENEVASAAYGVELVEAADGVLNTDFFKRRLTYADLATEVSMDPDGKLVQVNLRKGARDPIKFGMSFADINGIAMEGPKRMWEDATNLYYEQTPPDEQSISGLFVFYAGQVRFLRQRLNDRQVKPDIAYYFPDTFEDIYREMRREYHHNIVTAHGLALKIAERPELEHAVGRVVSTVDRGHIGQLVGELIRRKARTDE
jgi:hypothetical protein